MPGSSSMPPSAIMTRGSSATTSSSTWKDKLYYTFNPSADVRFFMLESTYPEPEQIQWLENELKASQSNWKIAVFHHPIYSSGGRHGSDLNSKDVHRQHGVNDLKMAGAH